MLSNLIMTDNMQITTDTFTVSAARSAQRGVEAMVARWWWAFALPVAVALLFVIADWRVLLAVALLLLVIYPGLLSLAYYNCALSPETVKEFTPHRVEFTDGEVRIVREYTDAKGDTVEETTSLPLSSLRRLGYEDNGFLLTFDGPEGKVRQVYVPFMAFSCGSDVEAARDILRPYEVAIALGAAVK